MHYLKWFEEPATYLFIKWTTINKKSGNFGPNILTETLIFQAPAADLLFNNNISFSLTKVYKELRVEELNELLERYRAVV